MINTSPFGEGSLRVNIGGFESTMHPSWHIQKKSVDRAGLVDPIWYDAGPNWYNEDAIGPNGYSMKFNPERLREWLDELRFAYPDMEWRMVIRVEVEKALDF